MHEISFPPLPVELIGAALAGVASWVGWMFARADRTADRRVEALEAITEALTRRVRTLEDGREKAEAARDLAEEEAHRLRVRMFRLEEYAAALLRWGVGLVAMMAPAERPPVPPSPPSDLDNVGDLGGCGVTADSFPVDTSAGHMPGDALAGECHADSRRPPASADDGFTRTGSHFQPSAVEAARADNGEGFADDSCGGH